MTPPDVPASARSRLPLIAVVGVVTLGVILRLSTRSDLWLDEALSVNIAQLPLGDIPEWLKHDGAPPLYYVLLNLWTSVFGTSDLAVRSLSAVFSVAALVAAWFAARQVADKRFAVTTLLLLAVNPFAIRYATEARMYSLVILLVFCGMIVARRAWQQPSLGRLALVALVASLLAYTQYWALYLLMVFGATMILIAIARPAARKAALAIVGALAVAAIAFLPWVPTFLYQAENTGTPWGVAVLPGMPTGQSLFEFGGSGTQEGWLLMYPIAALVMLGVFGRRRADGGVEIGLHGTPDVAFEATVGIATLFLGATLSYLGDSAFQPRYAAIVLPFFVFVLAAGVDRFADRRVHTGILAVLCAAGLIGGFRSYSTNRTQAEQVASILRAEAKPGDVVLYCPDQLGPAVHRLAPDGLVVLSDPPSPDPGVLVDWIDYTDAIAQRTAQEVADEALAQAGDRTIWLVSAPGYITHTGRCDEIERILAQERDELVRVIPDEQIFERPGLEEFRTR